VRHGRHDATQLGKSLGLIGACLAHLHGRGQIRDGTELVVGPFTCTGLRYNDRGALQGELTKAIVSAGAVGKSGMFSRGISPLSPSDSRFIDYK
jgi:hypothetical protein